MTMLIFDHKGLNKRTLVSYSNALHCACWSFNFKRNYKYIFTCIYTQRINKCFYIFLVKDLCEKEISKLYLIHCICIYICMYSEVFSL